ncbi:MAG: PIN-like domain-containing protein [Saprospiraceae bacterium]
MYIYPEKAVGISVFTKQMDWDTAGKQSTVINIIKMTENNNTITKSFSFASAKDEVAEQEVIVANYQKQLEEILQLKSEFHIFLDTNVLLRSYTIPIKKKDLLHQFFSEEQDRIIISKQVQEEFKRNRTAVRKAYANVPETKISDLSDQLAGLLLELGATEDGDSANDKEDDLTDLYESFTTIDNLSKTEKSFLKAEFDLLKQQLKPKEKNPENTFPGRGDVEVKAKFPYGDYYLYHEMLKYAADEKTDIIFLTFDVGKGDWLKNDRTPYPHYIVRTFALSQQNIFVIDANKYLEKRFKTSFEEIVIEKKKDDLRKPKKFVIKSEFEKKLTNLFIQLEKQFLLLARKHNIDFDKDTPAKTLLDDLNFDEIIADENYYELKGIWPVRDLLLDGNMESIRRNYTTVELEEVLAVVNDSLRKMKRSL